jgi:hypothetical protein
MIPWISMVFVVTSHFAFLILLIWAFSFPHFSQICQGYVNLVLFFQRTSFLFCWFFCCCFLVFASISLISAFIFIISLFLLVSGSACSYFSRSLRCTIRSLISDLSVLLIYALMAVNFPLKTAFAVSHSFDRSCFHFH